MSQYEQETSSLAWASQPWRPRLVGLWSPAELTGLSRTLSPRRFVAAAHSPDPLPVRWPDPGATLSDQEGLLLHGAGYVGLRSRFCDDYLSRVCSDGGGQVVILAAGLDTRAFRLPWPAARGCFEIDQPAVLDFKDGVLREEAARTEMRSDRPSVPI